MGKKFSFLFLLCFCMMGLLFLGCEARPYEPDYDNPDDIILTTESGKNVEADAEPALIMLRHMWQSVQELKRKQNSEDVPTFGQGLAQQLDVLRKLNRRQALRRQIESALESGKEEELIAEGAEFDFDEDTVAGRHSKMDPHFPSESASKKPLLFFFGRSTTPEPKN